MFWREKKYSSRNRTVSFLGLKVTVCSGCPGNGISIDAPPSTIELDDTSVTGNCVTMHISIVLANQFTVTQ
jgi:hypothetical protein